MNRIRIADITIAEAGKSSRVNLSFKEKMEVAKQLDSLHADVIYMPKIDSQADSLLVKSLAPLMKYSTLSVETGLDRTDVEKAWNALSGAKKSRISICVPTSSVQMEYICGMKEKKILELVPGIVSYAKSLCEEVEFSCKDATRSEEDFLVEIISAAIRSKCCESGGYGRHGAAGRIRPAYRNFKNADSGTWRDSSFGDLFR